jgi:hypothetical protein
VYSYAFADIFYQVAGLVVFVVGRALVVYTVGEGCRTIRIPQACFYRVQVLIFLLNFFLLTSKFFDTIVQNVF